MGKNDIVYIGICARKSGKRSGKDSFAEACFEYLHNNYGTSYGNDDSGISFGYISLADSLKEACISIFSLTRDQVYGTQEQKESMTNWDWPKNNKLGRVGKMTAREILQYFGTEIMRDNFDENVWVNSMKNKVKSTLTKNNQKMFVFVPDIRYVSESVHMDYLVDIYRKEAEIANKDGHKSEKSGMLIPDESISFSVVNDGTLKELKEKAIFFCENILLKDELWSLNKSEGTTLGGIV